MTPMNEPAARAPTIKLHRIAVIGFGEAGSILGADLVRAGCEVTTYDILLDAEPGRGEILARAARAGARTGSSFAEAARGADLVISAVTAASSADVAAEAGRSLRAGQIFLDINSCSPATKRSNRDAVEA